MVRDRPPGDLALDAPTRPDVYSLPATGIDLDVGRDEVAHEYASLVDASGRVPHPVAVDVTRRVWGYEWVCRFFHLRVEDAARLITGDVLESYLVQDAVDITGVFCKSWQGCPEHSCDPA